MKNDDQKFLVQEIRAQYTQKQDTELDELKALDRKVKQPAEILAYTLGSISALIMGAGMSLVMTDIGAAIGLTDALVPGIVTGLVGLILAALNWPVYMAVLESRKRKYGARILELSEKLLQE